MGGEASARNAAAPAPSFQRVAAAWRHHGRNLRRPAGGARRRALCAGARADDGGTVGIAGQAAEGNGAAIGPLQYLLPQTCGAVFGQASGASDELIDSRSAVVPPCLGPNELGINNSKIQNDGHVTTTRLSVEAHLKDV